MQREQKCACTRYQRVCSDVRTISLALFLFSHKTHSSSSRTSPFSLFPPFSYSFLFTHTPFQYIHTTMMSHLTPPHLDLKTSSPFQTSGGGGGPPSPSLSTTSFMSSVSWMAEKSSNELIPMLKNAYSALKDKEKGKAKHYPFSGNMSLSCENDYLFSLLPLFRLDVGS